MIRVARSVKVVALAGVLGVVCTSRAEATSVDVSFNFNSVSLTNAYGSCTSSAGNVCAGTAADSVVQTYMQNVLTSALGPGATVTVTGATASNYYTGDSHVTGVGSTTSNVVPYTLGSTDGPVSSPAGCTTQANCATASVNDVLHSGTAGGANGPPNGSSLNNLGKTTVGGVSNPEYGKVGNNDTFIDTEASTGIQMAFTGTKIYSATFDYEIMPNSSCATGCSGSSIPDFTFQADGVTYLYKQAVDPGSAGDPYKGLSPGGDNVSALSTSEAAWQLGPQTITVDFANGVSNLNFLDWPVTVAIDNLQVTTHGAVPEPATLLLFGTGLAGLAARRRYRATRT